MNITSSSATSAKRRVRLSTIIIGILSSIFLAQCGQIPDELKNIEYNYAPDEPLVIPADLTLPDDTVLTGPWLQFILKASNKNTVTADKEFYLVVLALTFKVTDLNSGTEITGAVSASSITCGSNPCTYIMALAPGENENTGGFVNAPFIYLTSLPKNSSNLYNYQVEIEVLSYLSNVAPCVAAGGCTTAAEKVSYALLNPGDRATGNLTFTTR